MEFIFNEKEFIEKAKKIGIKIKFHSEKPGMYSLKDGERRKFELEDVFPEVFNDGIKKEDVFILPELRVNAFPEDSQVTILKSKKVFLINSQTPGAA